MFHSLASVHVLNMRIYTIVIECIVTLFNSDGPLIWIEFLLHTAFEVVH